MSEGSDQPSSEHPSSRPKSSTPAAHPSPKPVDHASDEQPPTSDSHPSHPTLATTTDPTTTNITTSTTTTTSADHPEDGMKDAHASTNGPPPQESHPMVATSSSSSARSAKDPKDPTAAGTASPYGTRSRNRTTGARPNYAEDKDIDLEFVEDGRAPQVKKGPGRPPRVVADAQSNDSAANAAPPSSDRASGVSTRRAAAAKEGGSTSTPAANGTSTPAKDQIPGTSSFSATPTSSTSAPTSKKRKSAGASNTIASSTGTSSGTQTATSSRRNTTNTSAAIGTSRVSNMLSFEHSQGYLKYNKLKADDGTVLSVDDHVYLICEPPGEPYYLARIMEFLHLNNDHSQPVDAVRVNWYYRPRDIQRRIADTRVVFASMHSDTCPLTSLRGKCRIAHRSEVQDFDDFRKSPDSFWYDKIYDRYIHRYYDVIPTKQVINVPVKVKRVLDERWKYVIVEMGRGKELTSAVKSCKRCVGYCASNDSVECAVCRSTYHMNCVRPPLLKKPSRGFAWACGPCSRAQEKKLEARNTPILNKKKSDADEEEVFDEDEDDAAAGAEIGTTDATPAESPGQEDAIDPATAEQAAHAKMWPYRYLGIHCRVEDALDYDDRIYPRASSRLGPRHQAVVAVWPGRAFEFVKPLEIKRKYLKGGGYKKDAKLSKDTLAALEAEKAAKEKRPVWVVDEPPGYIRRGDDAGNKDPKNTARLSFRMPEVGEMSSRGGDDEEEKGQSVESREALIDGYVTEARKLAQDVGVKDYSTNFLDKVLEILYRNNYAVKASLEEVKSINRKVDLKEPELTKEEQKRFEEGVSRYGSELHSVTKFVKTQKEANIVRFYYMWKKTERGKQVWGNYEGRRGKKEAKRADPSSAKLVDDVADDVDDSAFDNEKAADRKRGFQCKFCNSTSSKQWRRAPGVSPGTIVRPESNGKEKGKDKGAQFVLALCHRCAESWRRYGIQSDETDEAIKKPPQAGTKTGKRKVDDESKELSAISQPPSPPTGKEGQVPPTNGGDKAVAAAQAAPSAPEPAKKKIKTTVEKETKETSSPKTDANATAPAPAPKKKPVEKPPEKPLPPERPKPKDMKCAVCREYNPAAEWRLQCRECRMTVHKNCYGVVGEVRSPEKWLCDPCSNDKNPQVSTTYECVLCPVRSTDHDFVRPVLAGKKKLTDKEREKEKERMVEAAEYYRRKQIEAGRPADPREPLKRTAGNNWVHVTCSTWTPEMKFGNAKALEPSEGIGIIASSRWEQACKICKTNEGACVNCHICHAPVHVACAQQAHYLLGFDITPVKSSRRDLVTTVTLKEESGLMTAEVWCKEHGAPKTVVHRMHEVNAAGLPAIAIYAQAYKQADLTLTGTIRKANLVNQSTKAVASSPSGIPSSRRASTVNATNGVTPGLGSHMTRRSSIKVEEPDGNEEIRAEDVKSSDPSKRHCVSCDIDVSPKWWKIERPSYIPEQPSAPVGLQALPPSQSHNGYMVNGDRPDHSQQAPVVMTNGHGPGRDILDLAAAAVTRGSQAAPPPPVHYQCHKCHWKKLREPSPPKPVVAVDGPPSVPSAPGVNPGGNVPYGSWEVNNHYPNLGVSGYGDWRMPQGPRLPPTGWTTIAGESDPALAASQAPPPPPAVPVQTNGLDPPSTASQPHPHPPPPPRRMATPPPPPPQMQHHVNGGPPPQQQQQQQPPIMHASPQPHLTALPHQTHMTNNTGSAPGGPQPMPRLNDGPNPYAQPQHSPMQQHRQHPMPMYAPAPLEHSQHHQHHHSHHAPHQHQHQHHQHQHQHQPYQHQRPQHPHSNPHSHHSSPHAAHIRDIPGMSTGTPAPGPGPGSAMTPQNVNVNGTANGTQAGNNQGGNGPSRSSSEARPLGGASASPSLRNLLS